MEQGPRDLSSILQSYTPRPLWKRGDYVTYFAKKMRWSERGMAITIGHLKKLADLAYIKSDCDAAEREGRCAWSAAFRTALGLTKKQKLSPPRH